MLQIFEGHVANIMHVRGLSRSEAERFAYEAALIDWLNATHPDTLSDRCAHCGKREKPDAILLPIGVGVRGACWQLARRSLTWLLLAIVVGAFLYVGHH